MSYCSGLHRDSRLQAAGARHLATPIQGISLQSNKGTDRTSVSVPEMPHTGETRGLLRSVWAQTRP